MNARRRVLLALCLLLCTAASAAHAAVKTFNATGKVIGTPSPSSVLAEYGVRTGSVVNITWSVELTKAPFFVSGPPDNQSNYFDATTWMMIQIGDWSAFRIVTPPETFNFTSVANDANGVLDLWHMTVRGMDNDLVVHGPAQTGFLNLSLDFYGDASAGSNQGLDQDPLRYYSGSGSALGTGGGVYFTIDTNGSGGGGGNVVDPTASCRKAQLKAGAKLCKSELVCHAKHAKSPDAAKRDECLDKADDKFTSAFDAAALKAEDKGLACGNNDPASEVLAAITEQVDAVVAEVDTIAPSHPPLESAWLGAAGAACFASVGARANNADKPDADKLFGALEKAELKLDSAVDKAVDKAGDQGVVFVVLDIEGFLAAVDDLIDAVVSAIDEN